MSKRFLCDWANETGKPVIYHCISRVVDRRFVLGDEEREKFRVFMRMQENFSGCRVLSYCLMSNHIHIMLEVPPMPEGGISDEELRDNPTRALHGSIRGTVKAGVAGFRIQAYDVLGLESFTREPPKVSQALRLNSIFTGAIYEQNFAIKNNKFGELAPGGNYTIKYDFYVPYK